VGASLKWNTKSNAPSVINHHQTFSIVSAPHVSSRLKSTKAEDSMKSKFTQEIILLGAMHHSSLT
jgi:hypothetical protein